MARLAHFAIATVAMPWTGQCGSSGRYDQLREVAFEYAYMVNELPVRPLTP